MYAHATRHAYIRAMAYIGFRAGHWTQVTLRGLVPRDWRPVKGGWVDRAFRLGTRASWMSCVIFFSAPCDHAKGKKQCALCLRAGKRAPAARPYHTVTIAPDDDGHVVLVLLDTPFEQPDEWTFVRLPSLTSAMGMRVFRHACDATFNREGMKWNFMPWWLRLWRSRVGLQANEPYTAAHAFFCSELATAFVVQQYPLPSLGAPCTTTPQMLHAALLREYPGVTQHALRLPYDARAPFTDMFIALENRTRACCCCC